MNNNRTKHVRSVALAVALTIAAGSTSSVLAAEMGAAEKGVVTNKGGSAALVASRSPGTSTLSLAGSKVAFRSTQAAISDQRLITLDGSRTVIALWNETSANGAVQAYYGLSLNGRDFDLVQPTTYVVRMAYGSFDPLQGEPVVDPRLKADAGSRVYMVQFVIPPVDEFRRDLARMGANVERFMTDHTHVVTMDAATAARVRALPYVRWVGQYHPAYKLSSEIRAELGSGQPEFGGVSYSVECFQRGPVQQQKVADAVAKLGGVLETMTVDAFRAQASLTLEQVIAIARMDEVNYIDPWGPGGTDMDIARQIGGAVPILSGAGFLGQGVRGEVHDTEVTMTHPQWAGQAPLIHATNGNSGTHGSSCYGINFATGTGDVNATGMLPQREQGIFFWYNQTSQFVSGATYTRLQANTEATNPALAFKSSFQTSSVGSAQITNYSTISAETDDYLFKVDYLSCQSQSNTGNQTSRPQAWAKNIVSVGGVQHNNTLTRADDGNSGASFGPAADGRTKPELAHFYDSIYTTTSGTGYTQFGGTSGATPITAGHFGLMMQMWHEGAFAGFGGGTSVFADRPQSATAKALMMSTAYRYPLTQLARVRQGWGMADVGNMYNLRNKMLIVNESDLLTNAQTKTYNVNVAAGEPVMAVTMSYKDPMGNPAAGQARINDLSLKVTSPTGAIYWGNNGLATSNFSATGGVANTIDTVENVFVQNPAAGAWTIEVIATSIVADGYLATPGVNDAAFGLVAAGVIPGPPPPLSIVLTSGVPALVPPGVPTVLPVQINPGTQTVMPGTEQLKYRFSNSGSFLTAPMVNVGGVNYTATLPAAQCGDTPQFYLTATGNLGGVVTNPGNAPTGYHTTQVGTVQQSTLLSADFTTTFPAGWGATGLWHPTAACPPTGTPCAGPEAAYYGQDITCNYATGSAANTGTLTAPVVSLPAMPPGGTMTLSYCSALQTENAASYDKATVLINGVEVDRAAESAGWEMRQINLAQYAGQNITIAFKFDSVDGVNNTFRGWHVDNVKVVASTIGCQAPACYANCDGSTIPPILNVSDFICFQTKYAAGDPYANCDGSTIPPILNVSDFICFQNLFAAGCS